MPASKRKRHRENQRQALLWAQDGICAGCGQAISGSTRRPRRRPSYPTLAHVQPRSAGGTWEITNLLLKHRACNEAWGDLPATGCDLLWQLLVRVRLLARDAERVRERVEALSPDQA